MEKYELTEEDQRNLQRVEAAQHAMQSGVAMYMNVDKGETDPKHLRVGINSAMSDHGALVALLCEKGIINRSDYFKYLADYMEKERDDYKRRLSDYYGTNITLI